MELKWENDKTEWEQDGFVILAEFVPDYGLLYPEIFNELSPERRTEYDNDEWHYGGIVVSVAKRLPNLKGDKWTKRRGDIVLAEESLWGIESDSSDEYFSLVAQELASEAIEEAQQTLKDLTA
jgi:hypothetical protein